MDPPPAGCRCLMRGGEETQRMFTLLMGGRSLRPPGVDGEKGDSVEADVSIRPLLASTRPGCPGRFSPAVRLAATCVQADGVTLGSSISVNLTH